MLNVIAEVRLNKNSVHEVTEADQLSLSIYQHCSYFTFNEKKQHELAQKSMDLENALKILIVFLKVLLFESSQHSWYKRTNNNNKTLLTNYCAMHILILILIN